MEKDLVGSLLVGEEDLPHAGRDTRPPPPRRLMGAGRIARTTLDLGSSPNLDQALTQGPGGRQALRARQALDSRRAFALAALWAAGHSPLCAQDGGVPVEFCKERPACTEDTLEIVFDSGTSTHEGPLEPGAEVDIGVVLDTKSAGIQGYSWAVKHDPESLTLLAEKLTTVGTIIDPEHPDSPLGSSWFNATRAVPGGFISAVVLAYQEARELPLGRLVICRAAYRVEDAAPCTIIRFVHGHLAAPRSPSVEVNITIHGNSSQPRYLRHGRIGNGACAETCDDLADNDGDGLADCADPECANGTVCGEEEEICDDGIDNDGDTRIDCYDRSCQTAMHCHEECADGIDNDGDTAVDCEDFECSYEEHCGGTPREDCGDGLDNDGDSLLDCEDPECRYLAQCIEPETCADGIDNDRDGGADCADRDCAGDPACPQLEVCGDGIDNDEDGLVDCSDRECRWEAPCYEICDDGTDNDGDGFVDDLDRDCTGYGKVNQQGNPSFSRYIRGDADGNGRINVLDAVLTIGVVLDALPAPFDCTEALNASDDGGVDLRDALVLLQYVFLHGAPLAAPFPDCGTHFSLGCRESSPGCRSQEG